MTEYKYVHCTAVDPENGFYGDTQNGEHAINDISHSQYTTHSQAEACSGFYSSPLIESQSPRGLQDSCKGDSIKILTLNPKVEGCLGNMHS